MSSQSPQMRRLARERAVQFLFGLDFTRYDWEAAIADFWATNPVRPGVRQYADAIIEGVKKYQGSLDQDIKGAIENWAPERVGRVERNILRIALYEMRHGNIPANVAISEAIEIAKRYGADETPRFINGVLDRLKGD